MRNMLEKAQIALNKLFSRNPYIKDCASDGSEEVSSSLEKDKRIRVREMKNGKGGHSTWESISIR